MSDAPVTHLTEALALEADALIDLWEIRFKGISTIARFWNGPTRTWQGNTYEGIACQLQGEGQGSEGQNNRPTLTIQNPDKLFGFFAAEGYFDLADVIRKRVLQTHFKDNVAISQQRVWVCGRPALVTSTILQLELRSTTDMPPWKTPRRTYSPSDGYPFVVL